MFNTLQRAAMGSTSRGSSFSTCRITVASLITFLSILSVNSQISSKVLSPQIINLVTNRHVDASSTCGDGVDNEEYCYLHEAARNLIDTQVHHGQPCEYCNEKDPRRSHAAKNVIVNNVKTWMSPPLSRSSKFHNVNLTIHLGQDFHVAYVYIIMGNSPRPGVWALERSVDEGKTYQPWQYFASDKAECRKYFGDNVEFNITRDDSVICDTRYSEILPFVGGEIHVPLIEKRPSSKNFSTSQTLQNWVRATNIRLNLMRTKTLSADVVPLGRQDPTVTRRYFYSIRYIDVGGRCVCNGHASNCNSTIDQKLVCSCEHNTAGDRCGKCADLYNQRQWRAASVDNPNECEKCNCHEHANACYYNETVDQLKLSKNLNNEYSGGGVCADCLHNTAGINCEKCKPTYYKLKAKSLTDPEVCAKCPCDFEGLDKLKFSGECEEGVKPRCKCREMYQEPFCDKCSDGYYGYPSCNPCDCFRNGTIGGICENDGKACPCKENFGGNFCKQCSKGFFNHPECKPCSCNREHSIEPDVCNFDSGKCQCVAGFGGRQCDQCELGYFNYPDCQSCECNQNGVEKEVCDANIGKCFCKPGFSGERCESCAKGFFGRNCEDCNCSPKGSIENECNANGRCQCRLGWTGDKCDKCAAGYYWKENLNDCIACNCDPYGAQGDSCDAEGRCICKSNFNPGDQHKCSICAPEHYDYPLCEKCNCNPWGSLLERNKCEIGSGTLCKCKERVEGRKCDHCKPLFYNLKDSTEACYDCRCENTGTHSAIMACETKRGQCPCKKNRGGRACVSCIDGTYNRKGDNLFGCEDCDCHPFGSWANTCDKRYECKCRPSVGGKKCDRPSLRSYVPTLHQFRYEVEYYRTPTRNVVRQGSNEAVFPHFSGMGYAIFSPLQPVIVVDVDIKKNSMHHVVLRYINPTAAAQEIVFTMLPGGDDSLSKKFKAKLPATTEPSFIRLEPFQEFEDNLSPGPWVIEIQSMNVSIDYLVTIPREYLSATALKEHVNRPCKLGELRPCRVYAYPPFSRAAQTLVGEKVSNIIELPSEIRDVSKPAGVLNSKAPTSIPLDGLEMSSAIFVEYTSKKRTVDDFTGNLSTIDVVFEADQYSYRGQLALPYCRYTFLCRSVVTDVEGRVFETPDLFGKNTVRNLQLTWKTDDPDDEAYLYRVAVVPRTEYTHQLHNLSVVCIQHEGACHGLKYANLGKKISFAQTRDVLDIDPRIDNRAAKIVELRPARHSIIIDGEITDTVGPSNFLIHYYQPDFQAFEVNVKIDHNGFVREGKAYLDHCASKTGCRARIYAGSPNNPVQMNLNGRFSVELSLPIRREDEEMMLAKHLGKPFDHHSLGPYGKTWLEDLIVTAGVSPKDLTPLPYDTSQKFIERCLDTKSYYLNPANLSDFCKEKLFTLTTAFNNGAFRCECNTQGSSSFDCEKFGGQCPCREHVIGRKCTECKPGYYGFPDCEKCKCPENAVCDKVTGSCRCPPNVIGANCDTCKPTHYDFNKDSGCEFCNCTLAGVKGGNLQCDVITGDCDCQENIGGRKCDRCRPGYYAYPYCKYCQCDQRGVKEDICDPNTARCRCKENAAEPFCDHCKDGHFFLDEQNPLGCTRCHCSGTGSSCQSAPMQRTKINDILGWTLVYVDPKSTEFDTLDEHEVVDLSADQSSLLLSEAVLSVQNPDTVAYIKAPRAYLGNRLNSYGGNLNVVLTSSVPNNATILDNLPDVVFINEDATMIHVMDFDDVTPSNTVRLNVPIEEKSFGHDVRTLRRHLMDRARFMNLLANVETILIRASYFKTAGDVSISISMDDAKIAEDIDEVEERVFTVEQCQCPVGYTGLSCEDCDKGFFRKGTECQKCDCNNHSNECDVVTGKCLNCQHNTKGDHCETCVSSYYGNATHKTPNDCRICPCPLATKTNNFGISCEVNEEERTARCVCPEGYLGTRCDACDVGYAGQPLVEGSSCKKCFCHGNNDLEVEGNCDRLTGHCRNCKHSTTGINCEKCLNWFWGDVTKGQKCVDCECNRDGSERCDQNTGQCICKPNVEGVKCDRCAARHWDLASRTGCKPCDCADGATNKNCNVITGECECKPGVAVPKCDKCAQGHWNLTSEGCQSCKCVLGHAKGMSCDQDTGQCVCLPGVIGDNCEKCRERDVFVTREGCLTCDSCVHELLDSTDYLTARMFLLDAETSQINRAVLNARALQHYEAELETSKSALAKYKDLTTEDTSNQFDSTFRELNQRNANFGHKVAEIINMGDQVLEDLKTNDVALNQIQSLQSRVKQAILKAKDYSATVGNQLSNNIPTLESHARVSKQTIDQIQETVAGQLLDSNSFLTATSLETLKQEEPVVYIENKIREVELQQERLTNLSVLLTKAKEKRYHIDEIIREVVKTIDQLKDDNKIRGLTAQSALSRNQTEDLIRRFEGSMREVKNLSNEITEMNAAIKLLSTSINSKQSELLAAKGQLQGQHSDLVDVVDRTEEHMKTLTESVENAKRKLKKEADHSHRTMEAANRYKDLTESIEQSENDLETVQNQLTLVENLSETVNKHLNASVELNGETKQLRNSLTEVYNSILNPTRHALDEAEARVRDAQAAFAKYNFTLGDSSPESLDMVKLQKRTQAAEKRTSETLGQLKNGTGKAGSLISILKSIKDAENEINQTEHLLNEKSVPRRLDVLDLRSKNFDAMQKKFSASLEKLREKILVTRGIANRIAVGVELQGGSDSQLTYRKPSALKDIKAWMDIGMYVNSSQPNGTLLYIGPDPSEDETRRRRAASQDYNAIGEYFLIKLENWKIAVDFALDSGAVQHFVHDDELRKDTTYYLNIKRVGTSIKITIRSEIGPESKITESSRSFKIAPGSFVFNVEDDFPIFIGHSPVKARSAAFKGQISNVVINNVAIGLWEFRKRGATKPLGAKSQSFNEELRTLDAEWVRFSGSGYAILNKSYRTNFVNGFYFGLTLSSHAPEGLLFVYDNATLDRYFVLQINNGRPEVVFKFGDIAVGNFSLDHQVNTGNEANIFVSIANRTVVLQVDSADGHSTQNSFTIPQEAINRGEIRSLEGLASNFKIGGVPLSERSSFYPGMIRASFEGCMKKFVMTATTISLRELKPSLGITEGCRRSVVQKLSLLDDSTETHKYLKLHQVDNVTLPTTFTFRFKTNKKDGLIFFAKSGEPIDSLITIAVQNGNLEVVTKPGDTFKRGTMLNLADNLWHYIVISLMRNKISIMIDGHTPLTSKTQHSGWKISAPYYIGGLDDVTSAKVHVGEQNVQKQFSGCIADFTVDNKEVDFGLGENHGVTLSSCKAVVHENGKRESEFSREEQDPQCKLRYGPGLAYNFSSSSSSSSSSTSDAAFRFGSMPFSRGETVLDPNQKDKMKTDSLIEFEFRVGPYFENGVLFLATNAVIQRQSDYILIYMSKGGISATFALGNGSVTATMPGRLYNDGKYHKLRFERRLSMGVLYIDKEKGTDVQTTAKVLDQAEKVFVGGIPEEHVNFFTSKFPQARRDAFLSFPGCIKDLSVNGNRILPTESIDRVLPCNSGQPIEDGTYFGYSKGKRLLITLFNDNKILSETRVSMKIKARRATGILFFSQDLQTRNYLAVYLLNGTVVAQLKYDKKLLRVASQSSQLCDGDWHNIELTLITLAMDLGVDGVSLSATNLDWYPFPNQISEGPIYLGGLAKGIYESSLETSTSFGGCIKDFYAGPSDATQQTLSPKTNIAGITKSVVGEVYLSSCYVN